ncbi:MAG TPA: Hsp70 family protein, partial [Bacteroidia bacterium]|nr:Hsp70 family protein [Bacteroidia bacterium]
SSGLSDEEIKKMKAEAEANAETDRKAKEEVEKINQADSLIFQTEKQLTDYGDKLSADKKEAIQKALGELKDAHKDRDILKIDTALATLNTAWQAASEEMYKATQNAGGAAGQPTGNPDGSENAKGDGEVTDVDFEEVKDEKK